jgi:hypothetical protein
VNHPAGGEVINMESGVPRYRDYAGRHYDNSDTCDEKEAGHWETETTAEPMVATSPRLSKSTPDNVRPVARRQGARPTAGVHELVEANLDGGSRYVTKDNLRDAVAEVLETDQEILRRLAGA